MDEIDFGGTMLKIKKPWGEEYHVFKEDTGVTILHINIGEETSFHYHENKTTLFIILKGEVAVTVGETEIFLLKGDQIKIPKRKLHKTKAILNSVILEYESTGDIFDLVRVSDKYKRGKDYESVIITTVDELIKKL